MSYNIDFAILVVIKERLYYNLYWQNVGQLLTLCTSCSHTAAVH